MSELGEQLRALGPTVGGSVDADELARRVMSEVERRSARSSMSRATAWRRRRIVAVAVAALALAMALTPAVRATVADWFGIEVRPGPAVPSAPVPTAHGDLTIDDAAELMGFDPIVPQALGAPDDVEVSDDHRVVSMSWSWDTGTVRLDEFDGEVAPGFVKRTGSAEFVTIDSTVNGLWFGEPHEVLPLDDEGNEQVELRRSAGPTLVWPVNGITLRLEGLDRDDALDVARSVLGNR